MSMTFNLLSTFICSLGYLESPADRHKLRYPAVTESQQSLGMCRTPALIPK